MKAIPCPITPKELNELYTEQKLTDQEIVTLIGDDASLKRVRSWRKRFGIETIPRWSRNEVLPIEGKLQSLLVGSMLGDGRLVRRTNATHYTENHTASQEAYLRWKVNQWGSWAKPDAVKPVAWKTNGKAYEGFRFNTAAHAALNAWQERFYVDHKKGWKRLLPELVDMVDEFALTIWYLDDGCAAWWPDISFGAEEDSRQVALTIFEKFGLKPRWRVNQGKTGDFHFEREDTAERFIEIIRPHVPDCMAYKLGPFGFQGKHYQVRGRIDRNKLTTMAKLGMPIKQIAREFGVGATTIGRRLDSWDIYHPRRRGRPLIK